MAAGWAMFDVTLAAVGGTDGGTYGAGGVTGFAAGGDGEMDVGGTGGTAVSFCAASGGATGVGGAAGGTGLGAGDSGIAAEGGTWGVSGRG